MNVKRKNKGSGHSIPLSFVRIKSSQMTHIFGGHADLKYILIADLLSLVTRVIIKSTVSE